MSRALNEAFARKMREFVAERDAALLSLDKEKSVEVAPVAWSQAFQRQGGEPPC